MTRAIATESGDFTLEVDGDGIAHLILGRPVSMPTTSALGHAEIAHVWHTLAHAAGIADASTSAVFSERWIPHRTLRQAPAD